MQKSPLQTFADELREARKQLTLDTQLSNREGTYSLSKVGHSLSFVNRISSSTSVITNSVFVTSDIIRIDELCSKIAEIQAKTRELGNEASEVANSIADLLSFCKDLPKDLVPKYLSVIRSMWSHMSKIIKSYGGTLSSLASELDAILDYSNMGPNGTVISLFVGPIWNSNEAGPKANAFLKSRNLSNTLQWTGHWWTPHEKWGVDSKAEFKVVV